MQTFNCIMGIEHPHIYVQYRKQFAKKPHHQEKQKCDGFPVDGVFFEKISEGKKNIPFRIFRKKGHEKTRKIWKKIVSKNNESLREKWQFIQYFGDVYFT